MEKIKNNTTKRYYPKTKVVVSDPEYAIFEQTPIEPIEAPQKANADLFEELKEVLLKEDRAALQHLQDILEQPSKLSVKISPIMEARLLAFKDAFPAEYRRVIDQMISEKLANSKEELLEAIYPIMGRLIKKYIALQFGLLKESIDKKMEFGFWHRLKTKSRSIITGVKSEDLALNELQSVTIEKIFVIQKHSGLLIASSDYKSEQNDLIAGMMTAIKSFAEDAFDKQGRELEEINYGTYKLLLEAYYSYYFVVAVSGNISLKENAFIHEKMSNFAMANLNRNKVKDGQFSLAISVKLADYFL